MKVTKKTIRRISAHIYRSQKWVQRTLNDPESFPLIGIYLYLSALQLRDYAKKTKNEKRRAILLGFKKEAETLAAEFDPRKGAKR